MKRWLALGWLLAFLPLVASARQIPVKTVPVATGDQFLIFPSINMSMGGISIALDDPLYDPFVNPAKGINIQGVHFISAPTYYGISMRDNFLDDASSARTLPVGMLLRQGTLFGGAVMAWQELSKETDTFCCVAFANFAANSTSIRREQSSTSRNNIYAFALAGAQLPGTNLSVGASVFVAGLNGLEGVRLLYDNGDRVEQDGHMSIFRLGLFHQWDNGGSTELTVLHHRFEMEHEMFGWVWDNLSQEWSQEQRIENDETLGWAVQAGIQQPLDDGWRFGVRLAGDWKRHPKIPNYDLMQIPRDPGNSSAYNLGLGFSRTIGQTTYGLDLIYEPIWSHTWADALDDTPIGQDEKNGVVRAGEMTVENFFRFDNSILRFGVRQAGDRFDFGLGLSLHSYRYHLDQEDFVLPLKRKLEEDWSEWTFSLGLGYTFTGFQLRYLSLITLGTGRPGVEQSFFRGTPEMDANTAFLSDFIIAPNGPLSLQEARVWTHQITLLIPITD